jgi:hypothetical protein
MLQLTLETGLRVGNSASERQDGCRDHGRYHRYHRHGHFMHHVLSPVPEPHRVHHVRTASCGSYRGSDAFSRSTNSMIQRIVREQLRGKLPRLTYSFRCTSPLVPTS